MFLELNKVNGKTEVNKKFKENMFQIIRQYGNEIFEKNLLYPYMTDCFPGEKEFLMVMKATYEDGVYTKLATFYNNCGRDRKRMTNLLEEEVKRLESKFLWSEEIAKFCIEIFEKTGEEWVREEVDAYSTKQCEGGYESVGVVVADELKKSKILNYKSFSVWFENVLCFGDLNNQILNPHIVVIESKKRNEELSEEDHEVIRRFIDWMESEDSGKNILFLSDGNFRIDLLFFYYSNFFIPGYEKNTGRTVCFLGKIRDLFYNYEYVLGSVAFFTGGKVFQSGKLNVSEMELEGGTAEDVDIIQGGIAHIRYGKGGNEDIEKVIKDYPIMGLEAYADKTESLENEEERIKICRESHAFVKDNEVENTDKSRYAKILKYKSFTMSFRESVCVGGLDSKILHPYIIIIKAKNNGELSGEDYKEINKFINLQREDDSKNIIFLSDGKFKSNLLSFSDGAFENKSRIVCFLGMIEHFIYKYTTVLDILDIVGCFIGGEVLQSGKVSVKEMQSKGGTAEEVDIMLQEIVHIRHGNGRNEDVERVMKDYPMMGLEASADKTKSLEFEEEMIDSE